MNEHVHVNTPTVTQYLKDALTENYFSKFLDFKFSRILRLCQQEAHHCDIMGLFSV